MQYIVEYATYKFEFKNRLEALTFAELMAAHQGKFSPWLPTIKVSADEEDKDE